jgi:hypothetical protein
LAQKHQARFTPVTPPRTLTFAEKQAILSFANRYPVLGKERADEIATDYVSALRGSNADSTGASPAEYLAGIARTLRGEGEQPC